MNPTSRFGGAAAWLLAAALAAPAQGESGKTAAPRSELPAELTQNPGCGRTDLSRDEKIERNRRIALLFHLGWRYYPDHPDSDLFTLDKYGCWADMTSWLHGMLTPPPAEPVVTDRRLKGESGISGQAREVRAWRAMIPNMSTIPGTFRAIPFDTGVYWTHAYGGTAKTGEDVRIWEVGLFLIDDAGRISHREFWNDSLASDRALKIVFGKSLEEYQANHLNYGKDVKKQFNNTQPK